MNCEVLLVDDEVNILKSIARAFRKEEFLFHTASSGKEGLDIVSTIKPSIIIVDMKMPAMSGVEFILQAKEIVPDSIFMILSGYADMEDIMKAINELHVLRYINKPWKNEELILAVKNAIEIYSLRREKDDLFHRVEEANSELRRLNQNLELEVEKRTLQLSKRNDFLQKYLRGVASQSLLTEIIEFLNQTHRESNFLIESEYLSQAIGEEKFQRAREVHLELHGESLGVLRFENHEYIEEEVLEYHQAEISLILYQEWQQENSGLISSKVQDLLNGLEE